ncbi:hypothetical protein [Amycolatopsis cihanbeyliensis]|uniref:Type VII secretion system (Wss) protein ESAT-6 n=1 Tax=Amycolatopsis cihanbeyliensis TaxID=1128664 RepID=A0A542DEE2_AMYCI|nr:hypothetical protein [Amycolatopsis cihanbeyliensis]TQJ01441.1 hypothetical protein FB471_1121 [Amycolatopsis cihanbeyliensis]
MATALNTTVNGSSGTCVEAADGLAKLYSGAHQAATSSRTALNTGEAAWQGPAHDSFHEATQGLDPDVTNIADRAFECEWALRDFADSLDAIERKMMDAKDKATSGGLVVNGPFIEAPVAPPPAPGLPLEPCTPGQAQTISQETLQAMAARKPLVDGYNAKVAVYNECKAIVATARTMEENAHRTLRDTMGKLESGLTQMHNLTPTALARTISYIGTMEKGRQAAMYQAERALTRASAFEKFANGTLANPDQRTLQWLHEAAAKARTNAAEHVTRANQFDLWIKTEGEATRKAVAAYPGKSQIDDLGQHVKTEVKAAQKLLKGMPYVGSGLVVVNEAMGAVNGEQSWGKAAADSAATIGGGALGAAGAAAAAGVVWGSAIGPWGTLVVGTVGGIAGAIGGQAVADFFVPE